METWLGDGEFVTEIIEDSTFSTRSNPESLVAMVLCSFILCKKKKDGRKIVPPHECTAAQKASSRERAWQQIANLRDYLLVWISMQTIMMIICSRGVIKKMFMNSTMRKIKIWANL